MRYNSPHKKNRFTSEAGSPGTRGQLDSRTASFQIPVFIIHNGLKKHHYIHILWCWAIPSMLGDRSQIHPQEDRFMYRLPNNQISPKPSCQMCCEMLRRRRTTNAKYFHPRSLHYGKYGLLRLRRQIITLWYTMFTLCSAGSFSTSSKYYVEHATSKTASVKYRTEPYWLNHGKKSPRQEVHRHAKPADQHLTTHTLETYTLGGAQGTTLPRRVLLLSSDLQLNFCANQRY